MEINNEEKMFLKCLCGGGLHEDEDKQIKDFYLSKLKGGNKSTDKKTIVNLQKANEEIKTQMQNQQEEFKKLMEMNKQLQQEKDLLLRAPKRERRKRPLDEYNDLNLVKYHKALNKLDKLFINPEVLNFEAGETAFDKNKVSKLINYRQYQSDFIEKWSESTQQTVILNYGVGSGKTLIAVNCAEQYLNLNPTSYVYFLCPASLVLNTMDDMLKAGINPQRQNTKGEYVYIFLSYQQLLLSEFNFKENSLLIIDEVHNLRNFYSKEVMEKISSRKYKKTDNLSLVGNKLAIKLLETPTNFYRCIFMTGTLFVNTINDLDSIMSIGNKKPPLHNAFLAQWESLCNAPKEIFSNYFDGLISTYEIADDNPNFPTKKFTIEYINNKKLVKTKELKLSKETKEKLEELKDYENDRFYSNSRNENNDDKIKWIFDFVMKKPKEKTLIYFEFINKALFPMVEALKKNGIKCDTITGEDKIEEKKRKVSEYNEGKINVLLFSLAIKEGISFAETENFIVGSPYWNWAITEQIIARGIRLTSHKKGSKSIIKIFFLLSGLDSSPTQSELEFKKIAEDVLNNNIKKMSENNAKSLFTYEVSERTNNLMVKPKIDVRGRDADLLFRMFGKQALINTIYDKLKSDAKPFEKAQTIENNEFIVEFNNEITSVEKKEKRFLTKQEKIKIKNDMYKDFYSKTIKKITSDNFKNVLTAQQLLENIPSVSKNIEVDDKIIKKYGSDFTGLLKALNIDKTYIVNFQAFFTPMEQSSMIVKYSGLENDTRQKIRVLEPTCGTGNIIEAFLKSKNAQNLFIDGNEYNNVFYKYAMNRFKDVDNVVLTNMDFFQYEKPYNYDYIIGNPPFNIATLKTKYIKYIDNKNNVKTKAVEDKVNLKDIDFIARMYEKLNDEGILCCIIGKSFLQNKSNNVYINFMSYLEYLEKIGYAKYEDIDSFVKEDETTSKLMKTGFPMVKIWLKKVPNFTIDLRFEFLSEDKIKQKKEEAIKLKAEKDKKKLEKDKRKLEISKEVKPKKEKVIKEVKEVKPKEVKPKKEKVIKEVKEVKPKEVKPKKKK
jgi:superfamily II DNA or RNA helicase